MRGPSTPGPTETTRTIVRVVERLPPSVLQEDAGLLMYYDNALMQAESQPEQGQLLQVRM